MVRGRPPSGGLIARCRQTYPQSSSLSVQTAFGVFSRGPKTTDIHPVNFRACYPYTLFRPSMNPPSIQRLIAFLCLVAFGLGQTVFASMGVRCTDASGNTRIEYACIKSSQGECLTPCTEPGVHATDDDHEGDPTTPTPCEDEPLGSQLSAAKVIPSNGALEPVFAAIAVAFLWDQWSFVVELPVRCARPALDRDRPPDTLTRLRSVILTV